MEKGLTETTTTETKQLSLMDENISQADYERLRAGEKIEVEVKSETVAQDAVVETDDDDSETSQTDGDEDSDSDESDVSAKDKEGPKKPKRGFKRRIEKLNAKLSAAEAQAEHWRQQALRGQKPEEKPEVKPEANVAKSEPNADDFESATEFYRAHAKWAAQEEIKAAKESERQEKLRTEAESKKTAFIGKVDEFKKAHDDFVDVLADVDDIQMSPAISQAILESDNGPELMYELAKNREEYERMCSLSPFEAVRALGRFEARLQKPSEEKKVTKPKTTTKAPPPPKPISTSSANGKKSVYDDDISQSEYERIRAEQEKRRASY
jgi:hypothetical protein